MPVTDNLGRSAVSLAKRHEHRSIYLMAGADFGIKILRPSCGGWLHIHHLPHFMRSYFPRIDIV